MCWSCPLWAVTIKLVTIFPKLGYMVLRTLACCVPFFYFTQNSVSEILMWHRHTEKLSFQQQQQALGSPLAAAAKISERRQVSLVWHGEIHEDTLDLLPLSNRNSNNNNPLHLQSLSWSLSALLCLWFSFVPSACSPQTPSEYHLKGDFFYCLFWLYFSQ